MSKMKKIFMENKHLYFLSHIRLGVNHHVDEGSADPDELASSEAS